MYYSSYIVSGQIEWYICMGEMGNYGVKGIRVNR